MTIPFRSLYAMRPKPLYAGGAHFEPWSGQILEPAAAVARCLEPRLVDPYLRPAVVHPFRQRAEEARRPPFAPHVVAHRAVGDTERRGNLASDASPVHWRRRSPGTTPLSPLAQASLSPYRVFAIPFPT